jgi:hypothetical protein
MCEKDRDTDLEVWRNGSGVFIFNVYRAFKKCVNISLEAVKVEFYSPSLLDGLSYIKCTKGYMTIRFFFFLFFFFRTKDQFLYPD